MADKFPGWTPYKFCYNNPLSFFDPDGTYEVNKKTEEENPELVEYLKGLVTEWNGQSDKFKSAFMEKSGLSEKEIIQMLTYGSGPKLIIENLDNGSIKVNGSHVALKDSKTGKLKLKDGVGLIKLDDDVVSMFQKARSIIDKGAGRIMLESTLFHESTHYGNTRKNGNGNGIFIESGKAFEKQVYGRDISRGNVKNYWNSKYGIKPVAPKPLDYIK